MFFESIDQFVFSFLIILLSQIIYASIGFGAAMFAITLFGLLFGNLSFYIPLFVLIRLQTELIVCIKNYKELSFKKNILYILFAIPFIVMGAYLLKTVHQSWHYVILGSIISILSIYFFFFEQKATWRFKSKYWQIPFGMVHGMLGSLYGMGGPALAFYLKGLKLSKTEFRNTSISVFFMATLFLIPIYINMKLLTFDTFKAWLGLMPAGVIGVFLGLRLHNKIPEKQFKRIVSVVLFFMGVGLIVKKFVL